MLMRGAVVGLVALLLFLAITAILGAIWAVPTQSTALLDESPFADYTVPALTLGLVGIVAVIAATLLLLRQPLGPLVSMTVGAAIIIFELVETAVLGFDVWMHALGLGPSADLQRFGDIDAIPAPLGVPLPLWLQPFYILVGVAILALGLRLYPLSSPEPSTPLPVIRSLTIAYVVSLLVAASPRFRRAATMRSLCSGATRAYTLVLATARSKPGLSRSSRSQPLST
jgi:hypothetical protein